MPVADRNRNLDLTSLLPTRSDSSSAVTANSGSSTSANSAAGSHDHSFAQALSDGVSGSRGRQPTPRPQTANPPRNKPTDKQSPDSSASSTSVASGSQTQKPTTSNEAKSAAGNASSDSSPAANDSRPEIARDGTSGANSLDSVREWLQAALQVVTPPVVAAKPEAVEPTAQLTATNSESATATESDATTANSAASETTLQFVQFLMQHAQESRLAESSTIRTAQQGDASAISAPPAGLIQALTDATQTPGTQSPASVEPVNSQRPASTTAPGTDGANAAVEKILSALAKLSADQPVPEFATSTKLSAAGQPTTGTANSQAASVDSVATSAEITVNSTTSAETGIAALAANAEGDTHAKTVKKTGSDREAGDDVSSATLARPAELAVGFLSVATPIANASNNPNKADADDGKVQDISTSNLKVPAAANLDHSMHSQLAVSASAPNQTTPFSERTVPTHSANPPIPVHPANVLVDRISSSIFDVAGNGRGMSVELSPPEYGRLRVEVVNHDGTVTARLQAETSLGQDLLNTHLGELRQALQQSGTTVDRIDVTRWETSSQRTDTSTSDQSAQQFQQSQQQSQSGPDLPMLPPDAEDNPDPTAVSAARGLRLNELNVRI